MTKNLEQQIRQRSKFQFTDILGKGRIRNLMYEYDCLRDRKNAEILRLKQITLSQSAAVTEMVMRVSELEKENKLLRGYTVESDRAKKNMLDKYLQSESKLSKVSEDFGTLSEKYEQLKQDHEELLAQFRKHCPDLPVTEVM